MGHSLHFGAEPTVPTCPLSLGVCCKTRLVFCSGPVLVSLCRFPLRASNSVIGTYAWWTGYAAQVTAGDGGGRQRNLTRRRRFCTVAVRSTSSLAPLEPRSRSRSSLKMRFMGANRISTFLRSRRETSC